MIASFKFALKHISRDYLNDTSLRIKAVYYFLRPNRKLSDPFLSLFLQKLIERDAAILGENQKYYINSQAHRERFRLWQTILTLLPILPIVQNYYYN